MDGRLCDDGEIEASESWEFIKWTMTENQETLAKQQSWIPVLKSSLENGFRPSWAPSGCEKARFEWMKYGIIGDIYHLKWREAQDKAVSPVTDQIFSNKISVKDGLKKMENLANEIIKP